MYMLRIFRAIWSEIRYRKRNFLFKAKISRIFNVLRPWDYLHFLTYIFGKLKGIYLTNEIGRRTLTIHNCLILHGYRFMYRTIDDNELIFSQLYNGAQDWRVYKITTKCKNANLCVLNILYLSIICVNDSFQIVTRFYLWLIEWVRRFFWEFHLNKHHFRLLQIKVN